MTQDRQATQAVARCLDAMLAYHGRDRSAESDERMRAEVQLVTAFLAESPGRAAASFGQVALPVEAELIARFGHEVGPRLFGAFLLAFEDVGPPGLANAPGDGPAGAG